jgi:cytochrome b
MPSAPDAELGREQPADDAARRTRIWDWPTRLFHWLLALCVLGSWITANAFDLLDVHMTIGYVTLGLLAFRLIWGVIGPRHARFASFLAGPRTTLRYLQSLPLRGAAAHTSAGHNPLGGIMVLVMLVLLLTQAVTGLFATDELLHLGPYNGAVSSDTGEALTSVHKANSDFILIAVWMHIAAILFYAFYKRQNLIGPMITGIKRLPAAKGPVGIDSSRTLLALVVAALVAIGVWWLLASAPPPPEPDFF